MQRYTPLCVDERELLRSPLRYIFISNLLFLCSIICREHNA